MPNQTPEPPRVTDGQIAEWDGACQYATPGPWSAEQWPRKGAPEELVAMVLSTGCEDEEPGICSDYSAVWPLDFADAHFIATARTALPALIAEVKRLKADLAWWNANTIPDAEFPHHPRFPADPRAPRTTERL